MVISFVIEELLYEAAEGRFGGWVLDKNKPAIAIK